MTANQMIVALQAAMTANGGDVPIVLQVSGAHAANDKISSVSSVILSGAVVSTYPGAQSTTPAVVNILLP